MLKTIGGVSVVLCLGLALAGCGGRERVISTRDAVAALRQAGFDHPSFFKSREIYKGFSARLLTEIPDVDWIFQRQARGERPYYPLFAPILALRTPSAGYAHKHRYTPAAVRKSVAWARNAKLLPRAFSLDKLRTARVCNILVSSYNANRDPVLDTRVTRAVALLKAKC
jgi:hypothetical protein